MVISWRISLKNTAFGLDEPLAVAFRLLLVYTLVEVFAADVAENTKYDERRVERSDEINAGEKNHVAFAVVFDLVVRAERDQT